MNVHKQIKSNKTNNGAKKNENEQAQICVAIWFTKQKKTKQETSQKNIKRTWSETNEKANSKVKAINRLQKQQKGKYVHKKSLKSREWHRQQPA